MFTVRKCPKVFINLQTDAKHYSKIVKFSMKEGKIKKINVRDDLAYMLY